MFINEIDVGELVSMMEDKPDSLQIIDVRSAQEVTQGSIPSAENIPMVTIPLRVEDISEDKDIILICRSGARSGQACAWLQQNGRTKVTNLRGGVIAWARSGLQFDLPKSA